MGGGPPLLFPFPSSDEEVEGGGGPRICGFEWCPGMYGPNCGGK